MTTLEQDVFSIVNNSNTPKYTKDVMPELWTKAWKYEQLLLQLRDLELNFEEL